MTNAPYRMFDHDLPPEPRTGGSVLGLVADIGTATRIAESAKACQIAIHNVDRAESLVELAKQKTPLLIIFDWDAREAESFKSLRMLSGIPELKRIPKVGFLSQGKIEVKEEAQRAGCDRVYLKTEFLKNLNELWTRYAK